MASSDNLFVWFVGHLHPLQSHFQLREVGALKSTLMLGLGVLILMQPIGATARLASAFVLLLVFGDLAIECYLNTLYVDASGIIAATACGLGTVAICASRQSCSWKSCALISGTILWLGTIKPQYEGLACIQGLLDGLILIGLRKNLVKALVIVSMSAAGPLIFTAMNDGRTNIMQAVSGVDSADTFLGAVLPAASNQTDALKTLGLPRSCKSAIGKNGYDPEIHSGRICPELRHVSRVRLLLLFAKDPKTFIDPWVEGIDLSRPVLLGYLHPFAQAEPSMRRTIKLFTDTSLSTQISRLTKLEYRYLMIGAQALGIMAISILIWRVRSRKTYGSSLSAIALLGVGGLYCLYGIASSVFGDGYIEAGRHEVLSFVGVSFFVAGLIWSVLAARQRPPKDALAKASSSKSLKLLRKE